ARAGGLQDHPFRDQRAHRRIAVLVFGEREQRDPQDDRQPDRDGSVARHPRQRRGSAARRRGNAASISASETAPTEIRNQPLSSRSPNAWNGTSARPAFASKSCRVASLLWFGIATRTDR